MSAEKNTDSKAGGYEQMFVMLAYLAVLITAITCYYSF